MSKLMKHLFRLSFNLSNHLVTSMRFFHCVRPDFDIILSRWFYRIILHHWPTCDFAGLTVLRLMVWGKFCLWSFNVIKASFVTYFGIFFFTFLTERIRAASSFMWFMVLSSANLMSLVMLSLIIFCKFWYQRNIGWRFYQRSLLVYLRTLLHKIIFISIFI